MVTQKEGKCISIETYADRDRIQDKYEFCHGMNKGDFVAVYSNDEPVFLFICCPNCGDCSFTGKHKIVVNQNSYTVDPSIVFNCCGWHGYLKDNLFKI